MFPILLLLLVILTIWALWRAFGPNSTRSNTTRTDTPTRAIGPEDDPDFLWNIKKEKFKAQREAERAEQQRQQRERLEEERRKRREQGES